MNSKGTVELCYNLADGLLHDAEFSAIAEQEYGKSWTIEIGFDGRRMKWAETCPFCVITAGSADYPDGMERVTHTIGVIFGINDNRFEGGLLGLGVLEKSWRAAYPALEESLECLDGVFIQSASIEFNQESNPMLYLEVVLEVVEVIPVGKRK